MATDSLAAHLQNLYLLCGTAIPVLLVALSVAAPLRGPPLRVSKQYRTDGTSFDLQIKVKVWGTRRIGLAIMLVGEAASLIALLFDWSSVVPQALAIAGVLSGTLSAAKGVAVENEDARE
jgi:hypothetical protein